MEAKKIFIFLLCAFLLTAGMSGCLDEGQQSTSSDEKPFGIEGVYLLQKKNVDNVDITNQFIYNSIELKRNGKGVLCEIDYMGQRRQDVVYMFKDDNVEIVSGVKTYKYIFNEKEKTLEYNGTVNRRKVNMKYKFENNPKVPSERGKSSFDGELFGDNIDEDFYNYCPTIMMEGNNVMHIWYCGNSISGRVIDYIVYRKGILCGDGKWQFTEKEIILEPTPGTWDHVHTCDPSVVKGEFAYNNEHYDYLMAYLGCAEYNCTDNEVGIAVAKSPSGPWIKIDSLNPIANYVNSEEYSPDMWGYGQPCVINIDKKGKVILFYTKGVKSGTSTYLEEWDFSNLNQAIKLRETEIKNSGVVNAQGGADVINNADFAYDPVKHRIYCIKEDFPYPEDGGVNWITGSNVLMYMTLDKETGFDRLFKDYRWNICGKLSREATGNFRNHNAGIVTDEFGRIINPFEIPVVYTVCDPATDYPDWKSGGQWPALHTYRLHGYLFEVN